LETKKKFFITLACIILVPGVVVVGASVLGGKMKGREICLKKGIPYHAVIAHRGASYFAPEETAPAYLLARDLGVDYLEGDIQRTKDGKLIVLHDDTFERTTNIADVFPARKGDTVDGFTLAEVRKLDAGSWFNREFPTRARKSYAGLKVLTLEELIEIASGGTNKPGVYLEFKSPERYPGIEKELVSVLTKLGWIGSSDSIDAFRTGEKITVGLTGSRVIFQSFDPDSVARIKNIAPAVPRVYLYTSEEMKKLGWDAILKTAKNNDAGLGPSGYEAFPVKNGEGHRAGLYIHVYTINKPWQMRLMSIFGADGIFTDRADLLLEYYGREIPELPEKILARHDY
jgi:glycerophosphoryl diester phosphodiesterase